MIIPYNRQHIDTSDIKLVNKVLKSNLITQGPNVGKFENNQFFYIIVFFKYL